MIAAWIPWLEDLRDHTHHLWRLHARTTRKEQRQARPVPDPIGAPRQRFTSRVAMRPHYPNRYHQEREGHPNHAGAEYTINHP